MSSSPYQQVAKVIQEVWTQKDSFKNHVYDGDGNLAVSSKTYALVSSVLSKQSILQKMLERVPIENVKNEALLYVLLYELFLGPKKSIKGGGALKRRILQNKSRFETVLQTLGYGSEENQRAMGDVENFPRYARVNTMKTSMEEVVAKCQEKNAVFFIDEHVSDLLVFHRKSTKDIQQDKWLSDRLILQDKSSCFSALCLVHGFENLLRSNVLDACAAPGNKTSHVAMLLAKNPNRSGKQVVYALDRSSKRLQVLQTRINECIPENGPVKVEAQCQDFLKLKEMPKDVEAILLDPSCSGSGIFTAVDRYDEDMSEERIESLRNLQVTMLQHAMSFPSVTRIVYSTCSVHKQENEDVIQEAISNNRSSWSVVAPKCLSSWKRRGLPTAGLTESEQAALIRVDKGDQTNGFFVACLQRNVSMNDQAEKDAFFAPIKPVAGAPLYKNQFASPVLTASPSKKKKTIKESHERTVEPVGGKEIPRKIQKKLAWKAKQRKAKFERLKL